MFVSIELTDVASGTRALVAVKRACTPASVARLAREAARLRAAQGRGVVELVDFEQVEGAAVLRTTYAGSRTLATVGPLPFRQVLTIAGKLASTLAELHARGLVHGRLEATHAVVGPDLDIRLCGFADDPPQSGATPPSSADDVAALGTLVRTLLVPLVDPCVGAREEGAGGWGFRPLAPAIPRSLRQLLALMQQAAATEPRHRPTAASLAAALRDLDASELVRARGRRRSWSRSSVRPPARRRPTLVGPGSDAIPSSALADPSTPAPALLSSPPAARAARRAGRRAARRVGLAVGGVASLTVVAVVAMAVTRLGPSGGRSNVAAPSSSSAPPASVSPPRSPAASTSSMAAASGGSCPETLFDAAAADVNGDGCRETVQVVDRVVQAGALRFAVGQPGDEVAVGDWDCDGGATAALLRPSTGEVFVFSTWPTASAASGGSAAPTSDALSVPPRAVVRAGAHPVASDPDGDGCTDLLIQRTDGLRVEVPTT